MSVSDLRATHRPLLPGLPAHGQLRRLALGGAPGTVRHCRAFTRLALHDWGWLPTEEPERQAHADDVLLIVSELVTNACRHAGGGELFGVRGTVGLLRIEVADHEPAPPALRRPQPGAAAGGYGLRTVALLADRWGSTPHTDRPGKTVWAEFDLPRA
ncbi:ATP-binding protein [Kitasatospora sp. NBC_01266]|uniref:ATP-binding protein n=1 Tax=Kitasatospora sp. NBC_01266 TaxID=2903572 RepID=UPI002E376727|nr:ATP-binding protein [Kitasatospora sp. NBC_01266]